MPLDDLDSNDNDYIDKKLMKIVDKSLSMFGASGANRGVKLPKIKNPIDPQYKELESVSDMLSKMIGGDLKEKEILEFKLGIMELIDNIESKYIPDASTRGIINKVLLMLLMRFQFK